MRKVFQHVISKPQHFPFTPAIPQKLGRCIELNKRRMQPFVHKLCSQQFYKLFPKQCSNIHCRLQSFVTQSERRPIFTYEWLSLLRMPSPLTNEPMYVWNVPNGCFFQHSTSSPVFCCSCPNLFETYCIKFRISTFYFSSALHCTAPFHYGFERCFMKKRSLVLNILSTVFNWVCVNKD